MKIIYIIGMLIVIMSNLVMAGVSRDFSETTTEKLGTIDVTYTPTAGDWSLDEILPDGWTVQGVTIFQQHLREYLSQSIPVTYTLVAPNTDGTYTFNQGQWQMGSDNTEWYTFQSKSIIVGNGSNVDGGGLGNIWIWLIGGVLLLLLVLNKKKYD